MTHSHQDTFPESFGDDDAVSFTYAGGRLEAEWLSESLGEFHVDRLISDVLFKVKGGKEANVYACRTHPALVAEGLPELLAAKLYRPEAFRAMKNDGLYRMGRDELSAEGKTVRDNRARRAMAKRTAIGREMRSASWIHHEYAALEDALDAGVRVPEPVAINGRAILMGFVGDEASAAPTLQDVALEPAEATRVFDELLQMVEALLFARRVHGDLSAYNVLYDGTDAWVIDLPQTIDPMLHPQGRELLTRDVQRLCDYFRRQGDERDAGALVDGLWERGVWRR